MMRTWIFAPLLAAITLGLGSTTDAAPRPVLPAATPFVVGSFHLYALRDMLNVVPNDTSVFGIGKTPQDVADILRTAGAPPDRVTLGVDALLVEEAHHVILIDTGLGPAVGGVLMQSLGKAGVTPDKVTDVLITHSHGDHIGGLVTTDGKPAFPNATVRFSKTEWNWLTGRNTAPAIVKAIRAQVATFTPGHEILPGITPVALPGHTPGHVGYQIVSHGQRLMDIGDTAHSSIVSLARPGWPVSYDNDKAQGIATRERLLHRLSQSHERIFAPHFPYPGVGTIVVSGKGYRFDPGLK